MAILQLRGVDTTSGQLKPATLSDIAVSSGGLRIGSTTSATALGDFSAGDGTREMFWDASASELYLNFSSGSTANEGFARFNSSIFPNNVGLNLWSRTDGLSSKGLLYLNAQRNDGARGVGLGGNIHYGNNNYSSAFFRWDIEALSEPNAYNRLDWVVNRGTLGNYFFMGIGNHDAPSTAQPRLELFNSSVNATMVFDPSTATVDLRNSGGTTQALFNGTTGYGRIGTSTSAVALGDFAAGDGTRQLFWDASAGSLTLTGINATGNKLSVTGSFAGYIGGSIENTSNNASAFAQWAVASDTATGAIFVRSSNGTPANEVVFTAANGPATFGPSTSHAANIRTGGTNRWTVSTSGHLLAGTATSYDIGSTTDAEQPRDVHINRALTVGDITASTSEGDIRAGGSFSQYYIFESTGRCDTRVASSTNNYDAPNIVARRSRGTWATSQTATNANDNLWSVSGYGYTGTAWGGCASIAFVTDGASGSGSTPGQIQFGTTPSASTTILGRWQIDKDGNFLCLNGGGGAVDIGNVAQGALSPRTIYATTSVVVGTTTTLTTNSLDASAGLTIGGTNATALTLGRSAVGVSMPSWVNVGTATAATAQGDFAAGAATSRVYYTETTGILRVQDLTTPASIIDLRVGTAADGVLLYVLNANGTTTNANPLLANFKARTSATAGVGHGATIALSGEDETGADRTQVGLISEWESVSGANSEAQLKIGLWSAGTGPTGVGQDVLVLRSSDWGARFRGGLEVGASSGTITGAGDIVAGDGTSELSWDASTPLFRVSDGSSTMDWQTNRLRINSLLASSGSETILLNLRADSTTAPSVGWGPQLLWRGSTAGSARNYATDSASLTNTTDGIAMTVDRIFRTKIAGTAVNTMTEIMRLRGSDSATVLAGALIVNDIDTSGALSLNSSAGVINVGNDAVAQNINIGTGAAARLITVGNTTTTTAVNLVSGATGAVTVDSLPLPTVLSQTTGVNLDTVSTDTLYTVPAGKSAIITGIVVRLTTATAASGDAIISVGTNASTYDDIIAATTLTALDTTTESFTVNVGGIAHIAAAAEVVTFQVDSADTGTTVTATVDLIGYLL